MTSPALNPTEGGSRFGSHYINLYRKCPMKWFNQFLRPHPEGGIGLETVYTPEPLMVGWLVHEGLAAYYTSGWRDGQYDPDAGVRAMDAGAANRGKEFETPEARENALALGRQLIYDYHAFYGPGGTLPEYPSLQIMNFNDQPMIEYPIEVDMGYKNYKFTARLDGICLFNGSIYSFEHKTTATSYGVGRLFQQMGISTQSTGQIYLLTKCFPDWDIAGVLVNALVKKPTKRRRDGSAPPPPFVRNPSTRNALDLEKFRRDIVATLVEIDEHTSDYNMHLDAGMSIDEAARMSFMMNTQHCIEFSACPYYGMCKSLGYETAMSRGLRARTSAPPTTTEEVNPNE